jgi:hypothetical protein
VSGLMIEAGAARPATSRLGVRQRPFKPGHPPVSGQLSGTASEGASHRVPASSCLSATGIRFLGHLDPPRNSAFLTVGLPAIGWTTTGFSCSARVRPDRGRCLTLPRGDGALPAGKECPGRHPLVHRRTVRQAISSPVPPDCKVPVRAAPVRQAVAGVDR